jgi:hypothetical protein
MSAKVTKADTARAAEWVRVHGNDYDLDGMVCPCPVALAELIADVREEEREKLEGRILELTNSLEAHDLHIGMASKGRDAAIRSGRYHWLQEMLTEARADVREECAAKCDAYALELNELGEWASGGFAADKCAERIRSGGS